MAPEQGVLLALAATALHGVERAAIGPDRRVLVLGQGPVGQLAARFAMGDGAWVAVCDRSASRLARSVGDGIIEVEEAGLGEALRDALPEPVDVIVEATGSMEALTEALPYLAAGGTVALLGYYARLDLPYMPLFLKEAQLVTAKEWAPGDLIRCRDRIVDGTLDVAPLITHRRSIDEVETAYDVALNEPDCLKLVLDWGNGRR
jgi:3-hydroxyethyl bacteriochlorophyllide a dehydrogenase